MTVDRPLSRSAQRVQDALRAFGRGHRVVEVEATARTAAEAAAAIGCTVGQIAKSLVFRRAGGEPLMVVASGAHRVDEGALAAIAGGPVDRPDADFVRRVTGYAIGGVPPIGHPQPIDTLIDAELLSYDDIWAAAGAPRAVFRLTPSELIEMTGGKVSKL